MTLALGDDPKFMKFASGILGNLAHPARLAMVTLLIEKERTVMELSEKLAMGQSATSQQRMVLRHAGMVQRRTDGARRLYRCECLTTAKLLAALNAM